MNEQKQSCKKVFCKNKYSSNSMGSFLPVGWSCHIQNMGGLVFVHFNQKNAEIYLELSQTSMMELFYKYNSRLKDVGNFRKKLHCRCLIRS